MIQATIKLNNCWVCYTADELEEHHVVPRSYGGSSGPTVTICSACHSAVHKIALRKDDLIPNMNSRWTDESTGKVRYLADVIRKSRKLVQKDTNKTFQLNMKLRGFMGVKLKEVQYALGLKNQDQAIEAAIDSVHKTLFGDN